MAQEVKIILDLSDEVHTFLEQQQINLYEELLSSVTPLIIRILNQYTPANRTAHWEVEETETRQPDGTVIIQRRRISSRDEQRPWASRPPLTSTPSETAALPSPSRTQP